MFTFDGSTLSKIFLSFLFVYCLIPFSGAAEETESTSLYFRVATAILIGLFAIFYKPRMRMSDINLLLVILSIVLITVAISFSLRFLVTLSAILMAFIFARAVDSSFRFQSYASSATSIVIALSVVTLFLQIVAWYGLGKLLLIHELVYQQSSSSTEEHFGFSRLGGMYNEPGTFSHWIYGLLLLHILIVKQVKSSYMSVVAIAMVCTLSVWGFLVGIYLAFLSLAQDFKTNSSYLKKLSFFSVILVIATLAYSFYEIYYADYLQTKLQFESQSGETKVDAFEVFMNNWQNMLIVGYGFKPALCEHCLHFQDAGVFIGASRIFGITVVSFFFAGLFLYVYRLGGLILLLIFLPLLICKYYYWDYILWMIFMLAFTRLSATFRKPQN